MKNIIENVYQMKSIEIDLKEVWQEALIRSKKIIAKVKKTKFGKKLKEFWKNYKWHTMVAGATLALYGFGLLPITIFIFLI